MLGLPVRARACLFDLEGVLIDSSRLHAWAWGKIFDDYLSRVAARTGWQFVPFDRVADYAAYVEGRSRIEGVHAFLHSRGIQVREGRPSDPGGVDTALGLSRRKGRLLETGLHELGVAALPGARRYLEAVRRADIALAVVCESTSTVEMLERAGLASLVDERLDAAVIAVRGLRSRPAPDLLVAACERLGVPPADAVTFTGSPAGVVAGRRAGVLTIGVAHGALCGTLEEFGAAQVIPALSALLDPRLRVADGVRE
jgi:HAD superfamily hydrolase (TIGR01509 family)